MQSFPGRVHFCIPPPPDVQFLIVQTAIRRDRSQLGSDLGPWPIQDCLWRDTRELHEMQEQKMMVDNVYEL